jgi:hypothetical protein
MVAASRALTNARSAMPVQCTERTSFDGLEGPTHIGIQETPYLVATTGRTR